VTTCAAIGLGIPGQISLISAIRVHDIDLEVLVPARDEEYLLPSGDQRGSESYSGSVVNLWRPLPSTFINQMSKSKA
jgi:hypothetical protein